MGARCHWSSSSNLFPQITSYWNFLQPAFLNKYGRIGIFLTVWYALYVVLVQGQGTIWVTICGGLTIRSKEDCVLQHTTVKALKIWRESQRDPRIAVPICHASEDTRNAFNTRHLCSLGCFMERRNSRMAQRLALLYQTWDIPRFSLLEIYLI